MSSYRVYFTLRCGKFQDEEVYPEEFASYEEAYDKMCNLYFEEQKASSDHPSGVPKRWKIYQTSLSGNNSMTQQA